MSSDEVAVAKYFQELSSQCGGSVYTVPRGKTLVIKYIASRATSPGATQADGFFYVTTDATELPLVYRHTMTDSAGTAIFEASESIHYALEEGKELNFGCSFAGGKSCIVHVVLGGHLK
jgi:hypothetical protein